MQDYAVIHIAQDYINALKKVFGEDVLKSKIMAF